MMVPPPRLFLHQTNHVTTQDLQDIKVRALVSDIPNWTLNSDCIFYYPLLVLPPSPRQSSVEEQVDFGRSQYGVPQLYGD
jgi:hypothetical protein